MIKGQIYAMKDGRRARYVDDGPAGSGLLTFRQVNYGGTVFTASADEVIIPPVHRKRPPAWVLVLAFLAGVALVQYFK